MSVISRKDESFALRHRILFSGWGMTGSMFKARTLLLVLVYVLIEFAVSGIVNGNLAVAWLAASLAVVQAGFVAGMVARGIVEAVG